MASTVEVWELPIPFRPPSYLLLVSESSLSTADGAKYDLRSVIVTGFGTLTAGEADCLCP